MALRCGMRVPLTIITLEFYKLDATPLKFKDIPDSQLGALGLNLYSAEIIDFIVEEGCVYGVKLMIGYGSGGMPPFSYTIPDVCNIGFLKLLVSMCPIHSTVGTWPCLYCLKSNGPLTFNRGETWGTLTIPMIQHHSPVPNFSSNSVSHQHSLI